MHPYEAADLRDRQMMEYDDIIDRIMDDDQVSRQEAEERYEQSRDKYLQRYEPDGCDD